jgi:hypothetical protein
MPTFELVDDSPTEQTRIVVNGKVSLAQPAS